MQLSLPELYTKFGGGIVSVFIDTVGEQGVWDAVFRALVKFYRRERRIQWRWQAVDSRSCAAPLGGSDTGKNPTDRPKDREALEQLAWVVAAAIQQDVEPSA